MQSHFPRSGTLPAALPVERDGPGTSQLHHHMPDAITAPRVIGRYLVSPLIKVLEDGWFASSVSICSGSGSATTDRILRLTRLFRCRAEAATFAHAEGLQWISASRRFSVAA